MSYTFTQLAPKYTELLARMQPKPGRVAEIERAAKRIVERRERYEAVEAATGVPWAFIAVLHYRESTNNFAGVLHNGDRIIGTGRKTYRVPIGRGPFSSWEEAAEDALKLKGLHTIRDWSLKRVCYEGERFNGWGYRNMGRPAPYLWSGSNLYSSGKYVRDHVYDPKEVDAQLGIIPIYLRVLDLARETEKRKVALAKVPGAGALSVVRTWLKGVVTAFVGLFTVDNAGVAREWFSISDVLNPKMLLAIAAGGFGVWALLQLFETIEVKKKMNDAEDDDVGTD